MAIDVEELRRRKQALEERLELGYLRIGQAEAENKDIEQWEQFWMGLLSAYDEVCTQLSEER